MYKFLIFIAFISFSVTAQTGLHLESELDSINTSESAESFLKTHTDIKGKVLTFNKEKHKSTLAKDLFALSKGGKKSYKTSIGTTHYKVIDRNDVLHYRVSIIEFDTKKWSATEIESMRSSIIASYTSGDKPFEYFAKIYSIDRSKNTGGDLGWLKKDEKNPEFETAVNTHQKSDLFSLDDASTGKSYIILKTEDWTPLEEITLLKISESYR